MKRPPNRSAIFYEPKRLNPEEIAQRDVVLFLGVALPPDVFYWHCPNGGFSKGQNGRNKAMGVKAGMPDLHFILGWNELAFIEMKALKGVLSDDQRAFRDLCQARGIKWALCRSVEDVEATLRGWGVALKATTGVRRAA